MLTNGNKKQTTLLPHPHPSLCKLYAKQAVLLLRCQNISSAVCLLGSTRGREEKWLLCSFVSVYRHVAALIVAGQASSFFHFFSFLGKLNIDRGIFQLPRQPAWILSPLKAVAAPADSGTNVHMDFGARKKRVLEKCDFFELSRKLRTYYQNCSFARE